jgi:hypothetical protein
MDKKNSIVRGPSIIFNRYHEANKTRIRNGDKFCKNNIGYDANDLHIWAIAQEMQLVNMNLLNLMI